MDHRYKKLLTPIRVGDVVIRTRMGMSKCNSQEQQGPENYPAEGTIRFIEDAAKNGASIITMPSATLTKMDRNLWGDAALFPMNNAFVHNYVIRMIDRVHAHGSLCMMQSHRRMPDGLSFSEPKPGMGFGPFGPGGPGGPPGMGGNGPKKHKIGTEGRPGMSSRGMGGMGAFGGSGEKRLATAAEIQTWIEDIANDALEYRGLGFDVVEVTAIGDLGANNTRTDQYGGSLENRCRATTEMLQKIRELCGPYFLISMQVQAEFDPQWVEMLKLWDAYVDIYHVRPPRSCGEHPSTYIFEEDAPLALEHTAKLKAAGVQAVIGAACGFQNPDVIEQAIEDGKCDMVFMARTYNCDPDYLEKIIEERPEDITPCLRCDACHSAICAVNPIFGLETVYKDMFKPSKGGKNVAVIGGGPAGLRAAMVCAGRGHKVTVFEKSGVLGGQANHADYVYGKWGIKRYKDWEIRQCEKLGVEFRLNTEATPELIEQGKFNAVIAATGGAPIRLDIPGGAEAPHPIEVFGREAELGHKVVVVGGAMSAMECAMYLRDTGHEVTVITRSVMGSNIGGHDAPQTLRYLKEKYADIREIDHAQIISVDGGKAVYEKDGQRFEEPFDSVVVSGGLRPCVAEAETFFGTAPEFYVVGDAQITRAHGMQSQMLLNKPNEFLKGNMRFATYSAFMAANNI